MSTEQRRNQLLEVIRKHGFASLPNLAKKLSVSESTIRRDLAHLQNSGIAKRTHGGAFYTGPTPKLGHFESRQGVQYELKQQIARAAAALLVDSETVLLDGGSTTYELAQLLVSRPMQIVTNSLPVANLFASSTTTEVVLIGGNVHSQTGVTLGPHAQQMLGALNVPRAVISAAAITEDGIYNNNMLLVETERAILRCCDQVILVADSTKFGNKSLASICSLKEIDCIVVDDDLSESWRKMITDAGVRLVIAEQQATEEP